MLCALFYKAILFADFFLLYTIGSRWKVKVFFSFLPVCKKHGKQIKVKQKGARICHKWNLYGFARARAHCRHQTLFMRHEGVAALGIVVGSSSHKSLIGMFLYNADEIRFLIVFFFINSCTCRYSAIKDAGGKHLSNGLVILYYHCRLCWTIFAGI